MNPEEDMYIPVDYIIWHGQACYLDEDQEGILIADLRPDGTPNFGTARPFDPREGSEVIMAQYGIVANMLATLSLLDVFSD